MQTNSALEMETPFFIRNNIIIGIAVNVYTHAQTHKHIHKDFNASVEHMKIIEKLVAMPSCDNYSFSNL